jgi:hypothetical protein
MDETHTHKSFFSWGLYTQPFAVIQGAVALQEGAKLLRRDAKGEGRAWNVGSENMQ